MANQNEFQQLIETINNPEQKISTKVLKLSKAKNDVETNQL